MTSYRPWNFPNSNFEYALQIRCGMDLVAIPHEVPYMLSIAAHLNTSDCTPEAKLEISMLIFDAFATNPDEQVSSQTSRKSIFKLAFFKLHPDKALKYHPAYARFFTECSQILGTARDTLELHFGSLSTVAYDPSPRYDFAPASARDDTDHYTWPDPFAEFSDDEDFMPSRDVEHPIVEQFSYHNAGRNSRPPKNRIIVRSPPQWSSDNFSSWTITVYITWIRNYWHYQNSFSMHTVHLSIGTSATVADLKVQLETRTSIPIQDQQYNMRGIQLHDEDVLDEDMFDSPSPLYLLWPTSWHLDLILAMGTHERLGVSSCLRHVMWTFCT